MSLYGGLNEDTETLDAYARKTRDENDKHVGFSHPERGEGVGGALRE